MPRRNRRPAEPAPLDVTDIGVPKSPDQLEAERDQRGEEWRRRQDEADDLRVRRVRVCVWPKCDRPTEPLTGGRPVPLCRAHAFDAWSRYNRWGDEHAISEAYANRAIRQIEQRRRDDDEADSRRIAPGWIYYLRIDDQVKIGFSVDVKQRLKAYPPNATLLAVHPGTKALEADLHRQFSSSRAAGREWFHPHTDLLTHIAGVVEEFGEPTRFKHKYRTGTAQATQLRARTHRRSVRPF